MTSLSVIFVMLLAVAAAHAAPAEPAESVWQRAVEVLVMMTLVIGLTHAAVWRLCRALRATPQRAKHWGRWYRHVQQIHLLSWGGIVAAMVTVCQWPRVVQSNWQLAGVPLADDLVLLVSFLLPLIACWPAFYRFEHTVDTLIAMRERRPLPRRQLLPYLVAELKLNFGVVLAPLLLVVLAQDLLRVTLSEADVSRYGWLVHITSLAGLLLLLPFWLRQLWRAYPLPANHLRDRLERAAARVNLRLRDLLIWPTNGQVANAVVAGFAASTRYVYLTDRLLELLTDEELEAVLLHEAAHIRRRHLWLRMALLVLPLTLWGAALRIVPALPGTLTQAAADLGVAGATQATLLLPFMACLYAAFVLGATSKWLEFDADLFAMNNQPYCDDLEDPPLIGALSKLATITPDADRSSWMHPSLHRRIEFLHHVNCFPDSAESFQKRLGWFSGLLLVSLITGAWVILAG